MTTTFRGRCPRHPQYNPATDAPAELDGNCQSCVALAAIHAAYQKLLSTVRTFPQKHREYPTRRRPDAASTTTVSQLALFALATDSDPEGSQ
ncbi:MAG: hypothetical protein M3Y72_00500 [Acidobacteriota bacterium]|nr:hypothetical protein [Acidobacteriota bacterium]